MVDPRNLASYWMFDYGYYFESGAVDCRSKAKCSCFGNFEMD